MPICFVELRTLPCWHLINVYKFGRTGFQTEYSAFVEEVYLHYMMNYLCEIWLLMAEVEMSVIFRVPKMPPKLKLLSNWCPLSFVKNVKTSLLCFLLTALYICINTMRNAHTYTTSLLPLQLRAVFTSERCQVQHVLKDSKIIELHSCKSAMLI